jgi:hypothetical protein
MRCAGRCGIIRPHGPPAAPDLQELYRWAVQDPRVQVTFLSLIHHHGTGRWPRRLREDFAGNAADAVDWLALGGERAIAVDIDGRAPALGDAPRAAHPGPSGRRLQVVEADVRAVGPPARTEGGRRGRPELQRPGAARAAGHARLSAPGARRPARRGRLRDERLRRSPPDGTVAAAADDPETGALRDRAAAPRLRIRLAAALLRSPHRPPRLPAPFRPARGPPPADPAQRLPLRLPRLDSAGAARSAA